MTEEVKEFEVENEAVETKPEFEYLKSITLVNSKGAEQTINAPNVVPGTVYRKAISLGYKERKLMYKNDGKGKYEKDEDGNLIPNEATEEAELALLELYEEFIIAYFNDQFTLEQLREGLDAREYQVTLNHAYYSAMGNPTVPVKK